MSKKTKFLSRPTSFSKRQLLIFALVFGLIGGYVLWRTFAAGPVVASVEAEQMSLPGGGSAITDTSASAGKAAQLLSNGTASSSFTLPSSATSWSLVARGSKCRLDWPRMTVAIDGANVLSAVRVSSTSWRTFTGDRTLSAGTHALSITFSNDSWRPGICDRNLWLDVSTFYGPVTTTPSPTVTLGASPSAVTAGSAATLTWNSTNATACIASGAWSGAQPTAGSTSTGALNTNASYSLTCSGTGGSASAMASVTVSAPVPVSPPSSSGTLLGVYKGGGKPAAVASFESWLGKSVPIAGDFLPRDTWASISSSPDWLFGSWTGKPYRLVVGVPMIPDTGGTLAAGANGDYNAYFKTLAQSIVAKGQGNNTVLRLGWEFGGSWYRWHVSNTTDAANFAAYWRQIVNTMRAEAPNLKFDWNPIWGYQAVDPTLSYPGDSYVDYIGVDVYDQSWVSNYTDPAARWNDYINGQWGGNWHKNFAAAHGKQMTFPEWGVAIRSDGHGGGDSPYYIQHMYDWIKANNVAYSIYFMFDASDGQHDLLDGKFPNSAALFKQLFGQ